MLANLLGHFPLAYVLKPVDDYLSGEAQNYQATFYLGSWYGSDLFSAFLADVRQKSSTFCWFKYNWEAIDNTFRLVQGTGTIQYHGKTFTKHPADLELGAAACEPGDGEAIAWAGFDGDTIPCISRKGDLWYVADLPFSYISEQDHYLVFADILHDTVGIDHAAEPRALLRIEDIDPVYSTKVLSEVADYLSAEGVPFAVSVIPVYCDPTGHYNDGKPERYAISDADSRQLVDALHYMEDKGGRIFLHGYTHQHGENANPWTEVTADDFEFYLVEEDAEDNLLFLGPVPEDSKQWVRQRIRLAKSELRAAGLSPTGWVTPHYTASPLAYQHFASEFPVTIQRVLYFNGQFKIKGKGDNSWSVSEFAGQFFPYVIETDIYGQKILPENLGYFDPVDWTVDRMESIAETNLALGEPWTSMFFHPFFDLADLEELVRRVRALSYEVLTPSPELI